MTSHARLAAFLAAVLLLAGCSGITTSVDYDRAADFSRFKTYAWKDVHPVQNEIVENRIKSAVDRALAAKGFRKVETGPDLWVVEHISLTKEKQLTTYDSGWGYGYRGGWGGGMTTATVSEIPIGELVLDLVDAKQNQMVWRGTATKAIDQNATPQEREKTTDEAVQKLFAGFPPGKSANRYGPEREVPERGDRLAGR
ncbi:MAG TPA: DUF4136 domain-containing protein [Thermoanaerobaculia bacterium]|nr:DUF4136 domain-containing protein [Thermoanaerobaculia bacterium]